MGVPALFRWLSKKYPKIVQKVIEDPPQSVADMSPANPNGTEFDCLYLDMNAIVHPCTHPEGKPAPETEEEMMLAIFEYTDRVVRMIRPRKLLMLAIDGVAPRAKMNQQRSRRFRAAREAAEKDAAFEEGVEIFAGMGKDVERRKKTWDTNAITPGTPFMDFLAASLRYWITRKLNSDPGWAGIQVILSDASVPGEGEHKIMDYIRRQRTHDAYDHNTSHVIYGLDADLIMLALATHEMHFSVLREDVFAQSDKPGHCRKCGAPGHIAAHCAGAVVPKPEETEGAEGEEKKEEELKPFIFLNVSVLREYLLSELSLPAVSFFDLERAIDDWVLLIFFVGNDFLPHLPSLEIREGAIDTLLRIWKAALPAMGGYVTNNGKLDMPRLSFILEGLAQEEDRIFQRRKETEQRQDANSKRRKMEQEALALAPVSPAQLKAATPVGKSKAAIAAAAAAVIPADLIAAKRHALPSRPLSEIARDKMLSDDAKRANLSAAEKLRKELAGNDDDDDDDDVVLEKTEPAVIQKLTPQNVAAIEDAVSLTSAAPAADEASMIVEIGSEVADAAKEDETAVLEPKPLSRTPPLDEASALLPTDPATDEPDEPISTPEDAEPISNRVSALKKRKAEILETVDSDQDDDTPVGCATPVPMERVKNSDGTVDQEDTVKLWEPGYKTRYYEQKFGKSENDIEFRNQLVKSYLEGLSWVLAYYFQGCPSWQWFYPYHYAPFAADFQDISSVEINFTLGQPFKPFEQLMGVFPAASGIHIPLPFRKLMTENDSPILDFYPEEFEIDMNGKKMEWQGIAILPFIEQDRLLPALDARSSELTEDEVKRNTMGHTSLFVSELHPMFSTFCTLYGKRKTKSIDVGGVDSNGLSGTLEPEPDFIPSSSYDTPLPSMESMGDIPVNRSIVSRFEFPAQRVPHRSAMLPKSKRPTPALTPADHDFIKFGGYDRRDGPNSNSRNSRGRGGYRNNGDRHSSDSRSQNNYSNSQPYQQSYSNQTNHNRPIQHPPTQPYNAPAPAAFASYQERLRTAGRQQQPRHNAPSAPSGYAGYGGYGGAQSSSQPMYGQTTSNYGGYGVSNQPHASLNYGGYGQGQAEARPTYRHSYGGSNNQPAPAPNSYPSYPQQHQQPGLNPYGSHQNQIGYQSHYASGGGAAAGPQYGNGVGGQYNSLPLPPPPPPAPGYGGYGLNQRPPYR